MTHMESLGLDNRTLAAIKRGGIERVARLVDAVRKGELGSIPNIGKDRVNTIVGSLKAIGVLEEEFEYQFSKAKYKPVKFDFKFVPGDDAMPFVWQDEEWLIEVEGWSTLWGRRKLAGLTLIAMYELTLADDVLTKENIYEQYCVVAKRMGLNEPKSMTTVQRQFELLAGFHIDGSFNPFVIQKGEKSKSRQENSDAPGRGGEAGLWWPVMSYPRMPIGGWQSSGDNFEIETILDTDDRVLIATYKGKKKKDEFKKQQRPVNPGASTGGQQPIN